MHTLMNTRLLQLMLLMLLPFFAMAQRGGRQRESNTKLTIFSPDKEPFFVVLDGERLHREAQTYVTVEGLPNGIYKLEIEFKDVYIPLIRKNIELPGRGPAGGAIYKIGWRWDDKPELVQASIAPMTGKHTIYYSIDQENWRGRRRNEQPRNMGMAPLDFNEAKQTIKSLSFDDSRLSTAKGIVYSNPMTTEQVCDICRLFSFEQSRLEFAKYAYQYTVDPNNYFKVNKTFNFSSSADELNQFIYGR